MLSSSAYANRLKAIGQITKGLAGWVAAGSVATAGGVVTYKTLKEVLKEDEGGYAFYMVLDKNASALYWADVWSRADIYAVVTIDGIGSYLLPDIRYDYSGEQIRWNIRIPVIPKGRKVLVQIYDDDSSSNELWNGILQARGRVMFDGGALVGGLKLDADFKNINILDRTITLDARDYVCEFLFEAPSEGWFNRQWTAEGELRDSNNVAVGKIGFAQIDRK